MKKRLLSLFGLMAVTCWLVSAADIDGKWTTHVDGKNGNKIKETISLKSNGNKLTGSFQRKKANVEISDGTINGQNVSFKVAHKREGKTFTQQYKGTISGDDLKLTVTGSKGKGRDVAFKKAK